MTSVMDPEENTSTFSYDGLGREIKRELGNGNTITRAFNKDGNLTNIANKNDEGIFSSYAYEYDKNGNRILQTEEDGAQTT
jgi:YD repeat-containing protein